MDHSGHGGMDMGGGTSGAACKISMMWNWYTIDACFISKQWHVRTMAGYAGTIVGVFFWVVLLEGVRRLAREYDRKIVAHHNAALRSTSPNGSTDQLKGHNCTIAVSPTHAQQAFRSLLYMIQFGAGYMLMLMAMYYNGGVILTIFIGAFVGYFFAARDTLAPGGHETLKDACC